MFRLRRHKSSASDYSGEKFGFVFSNIQALQVPRGWDKLSVSLTSAETGKVISKLEKASVNNGTCRWTESLWSPEDSKDLDHFMFIVSMGSSRSSILGEATVNVENYKNSEASIPISLPLKKCNKGTVLNFEIKCLTPRTSFRSDEWNSSTADTEEENSVSNRKGNKSEEMNHSSPSMEYSLGRDSFSSASNSSNSAMGRLEYPAEEIGQYSVHAIGTSLQHVASSTNSPQTENANTEEFKAEAKMWELNARRLMMNMETLRKEFADQTQHIADLEMELSASHEESNRLVQENMHLQVLLEESNAKQIAAESLNIQAKNTDNIRKELEDELRFQRESNNNLSLQLRKSQESNIELVSVLQELEEIVQKQKMEIENLLALKSRSNVVGAMSGCGHEDNSQPKSAEQVSVEKHCQQESHMFLENNIISLEKALEKKIHEVELERDLRAQDLFNCEEKWKSRTISVEKDIADLELKLSKETESLKKTIQELERECKELTEENLELVLKFNESRKALSDNHDMLSSKSLERPRSKPPTASEFQASKHGSQCMLLEEEVVPDEEDNLPVQKSHQRETHSHLDPHCQRDFETEIDDRQMLAWTVENDTENLQIEKEGCVTSDNMKEDTVVKTGSVFTHISDKIQEMKFLELEAEKQELESSVCELEKENLQLSERVCGLEAQLRHLTDGVESSRMELQSKETHLSNLQEKIRELEKEKELQNLEMKQRLTEMQKRWLDAQEESEFLNKANPKLQATAESLIEECDSLQVLNGELRQQRLELKVQCNHLEVELRKYQHSFSNWFQRIESLEAKLSSVLEEASSKEKIMNSELEVILLQNKEYEERLVIGESLKSQQKLTEFESQLEKDQCLDSQVYDPCDTEDRKDSKGSPELHSLLAENKRLKITLQEIRQNLEISGQKLVTAQKEHERKVRGLMSELDASKTYQEVLTAQFDKLQRWLECVTSSEANLKCRIDDLESKLLLSESERQQLADANSSLKTELLKIALLQDEVLALKGSLDDMKFKNERLEASLQLICGENEELKAEKNSMIQELNGMKNSVTELEECRRRKVVLEGKVLRLEGDLTAGEVMSAKDAELKNELGRIKRANTQLSWKIKQLQLERDYLLKETQSLQQQSNIKQQSVHSPCHSAGKEVTFNQSNDYETAQISAIDCSSRSLPGYENTQIKSLQGKEQEYKHKISELQAELEEINDKYLNMSLKYAEVENQKGKLVMTLKALQDQKTRSASQFTKNKSIH